MTVTNKSPKGNKLLVFKILAILFPLVLLLVFEVLLRLFDYGHNVNLFIKYPGNDRYLVMNKYASEKYFSDTLNATRGNHEMFQVDKSPNTFRVFVLGESTTIGYPYFHNGSFHRWLQYRLMQMYPNKNFEIINLSLTAVNSYTVLDFGKQLAQYQPDAVMIYTGHNEYYGALGVGSTSYVGSNRFLVQTLLKLRELKLVQLLNNTMKSVAGVFAGKKINDRETLMKRMAARQQISYQSADFKAGIRQYEENMTELCKLLNDEKIPVFLSTVVSNEKDLKPFISGKNGGRSADYYYQQGQLAYAQSNFAIAKVNFVKAKELDELRFRAPEAVNAIVQNLTTKYPYVHLVDTRKVFEQYSPNGILGKETILEHVHPNLFGYALMSEAFYQAFQQQKLVKDVPEREFTFAELQKEMPITRLDSLNGMDQINMLKTGWPFNQPAPASSNADNSVEASLAQQVAMSQLRWDAAMSQLFEYDKKTDNKAGALKIMEAMVLEDPQSEQFYGYAGNLNAILNNNDKAVFYYQKLFMLNSNPQVGQTIYQLNLRADHPEQALPWLQYIPQQQQDGAKALLNQVIADKAILKKDSRNTKLNQQVAADYKALGMEEAGTKYSKAANGQ